MSNFKKLGLSKSTLEVLDHIGFENPTPIQEKAIPLVLGEDPTDFIGLAQTGTGKTAAFGLPLLELIDDTDTTTQALIMAPTRELGQQIAQQFVDFSQNRNGIYTAVVYGGASIVNQMRQIKKGVQIVVATPGRLLDLIQRKAVNLEWVRYVVLDEADEMLNMGFKEDIDKILSYTPEDRVTWLFSATMPGEIRKIVKKYMNSPIEVSVSTEEKVNKDIAHKFVVVKAANKFAALRRFLDIQPDMRGVMFCRTKRETQKIADDLGSLGYGVEALHGDLSQGQRDSVMKRFKQRSMQLLIATDVAARGIDVIDLSHVIHYNLPDQTEGYTHRSGRTARAGKKGTSISFINPREGRKIEELEKRNKIKFEKIEVPSVESLKSSRINNWASLIINTKVDEQADEILNQLHGQFEHLSKEDLLKRLITSQLDHLLVQGGEDEDLNEKANYSDKKQRSDGKFNRYFINVGLIDGMTKGDLVHFLSDISGLDRKFFGQMSMQRNHTYFDVDSKKDSGLGKKFQGIQIEGRNIRVNRDDEGPKRSRNDEGKKARSKPKRSTSGSRRDYKSSDRKRSTGKSFSRRKR